jgi:hypothetical protein
MDGNTTTGIPFERCIICNNYHTYSAEMCNRLHRNEVDKIEPSQPPMILIPDYKDQLQTIIDLLKEIKYNTDRLRIK